MHHSENTKKILSEKTKIQWKNNREKLIKQQTEGKLKAYKEGRKISWFKGKIPWNKGKKYTYEELYGTKRAKKIRKNQSYKIKLSKRKNKLPNNICKTCGLEIASWKIYCNKKCYSISRKGHIPWNKGTKGIMPSPWNKGTKGICKAWNKGIHPDYLQKENHPRWKGGITSEHQNIRNSQQYKEWAKKVYKRDNYTCKMCNIHCDSKKIVAHHIKSFSDYIDLRFDINNGITLCRQCHAKLHKTIDLYTRKIRSI